MFPGTHTPLFLEAEKSVRMVGTSNCWELRLYGGSAVAFAGRSPSVLVVGPHPGSFPANQMCISLISRALFFSFCFKFLSLIIRA